MASYYCDLGTNRLLRSRGKLKDMGSAFFKTRKNRDVHFCNGEIFVGVHF